MKTNFYLKWGGFILSLCKLLAIVATSFLLSCSDNGFWRNLGWFSNKTYGCEETFSVATPFGKLANNVWNRQGAGIFDWHQCIGKRLQNGKWQYDWDWGWPTGGNNVYAYPEVIVGAKPWLAGPGNDARFPRRVADTKHLLVAYNTEIKAAGEYNLAASIWLIRSPLVENPPKFSTIATEIMIWTESTPVTFVPGGTKRGEVSIGNIDWEVWVAEDWGDISGLNPNRWRYVAYRAKTTKRSIRYDARRFINDAINRGLATKDLYIADVELGNEIIGGNGTTRLKSFSVVID